MCLVKSSIIPRITLKPKIVYKVLYKDKGNYYTPFMDCKVELNKLYIGEFFGNGLITFLFSKYIDSGFIHSYDSIDSAINNFIDASNDDSSAIIIKCEIPRFTLYYKGHCREIASRKLKYISEEKRNIT